MKRRPFGQDYVDARRPKEPGLDLEEARGRLRVEEVEAEAARCAECAAARAASGDPSTFCAAHLRRIYGTQG